MERLHTQTATRHLYFFHFIFHLQGLGSIRHAMLKLTMGKETVLKPDQ
jgi:hypothetical protein